MRKLVFTVISALVFAAPLAAQAQDKKTVTIAVSGPPAQLYFLPVVLAKQLGYFDQSHLTNSLRRYVGQTPAQISLALQPE